MKILGNANQKYESTGNKSNEDDEFDHKQYVKAHLEKVEQIRKKSSVKRGVEYTPPTAAPDEPPPSPAKKMRVAAEPPKVRFALFPWVDVSTKFLDLLMNLWILSGRLKVGAPLLTTTHSFGVMIFHLRRHICQHPKT